MNKDENLQVQRTKFSNLKRFDNAAFKDCIDLRNEWNFKLGGIGTWKVGFVLFN